MEIVDSNRTIAVPEGSSGWQFMTLNKHPIRLGIHRFSFRIAYFVMGIIFGAVIQEWQGWTPKPTVYPEGTSGE